MEEAESQVNSELSSDGEAGLGPDSDVEDIKLSSHLFGLEDFDSSRLSMPLKKSLNQLRKPLHRIRCTGGWLKARLGYFP